MNPAMRIWDLPAPPGTEEDELSTSSFKTFGEKEANESAPKKDDEDSNVSIKKDKEETSDSPTKPPEITGIQLKDSEESESTKRVSPDRKRHRSKSRSRSRDRHRGKYSRDRSRRSHSRSKRRRRRHSSSKSRSRSRSRSYGRYRHQRFGRRRRSRSRSRSNSRSRGHRSSYKSRNHDKSPNHSRKSKSQSIPPIDADINEVDMKIDEEEDEQGQDNVFKNDGTFLEMFKKLQEQKKAKENPPPEETKKPTLPTFGKRRGGKVLKTGMVQKVRHLNDEEGNAQDAWAIYMKEVRKYKEACCDDDSKTRPLVK